LVSFQNVSANIIKRICDGIVFVFLNMTVALKFFFLAAIIFIAGAAEAQPTVPFKSNTDNNTLLWEVSGNGLAAPSYLFGTFHILCKEDIQFSDALKQAVKNTSVVYMELDMDDAATLLGGLNLIQMTNGKKLKELFTAEEYKRVESFFKDSLKTSFGFYQGTKPLMLTSLIYPRLLGCKTVTGMEQQLLHLARENKKEIHGLETLEFQASIMDSIPYKDQAVELLKTIDSLKKSKIYFDSMVVAYKKQDMAEIERMLSDEAYGMEDKQDIMLDKRNRNWVDKLKTIMQKDGVFIAVGAGHLPGQAGVIALLRKEGYVLRPLENK
jgi:uncharacterized protein YbaP (TraB family)